MNIALWLVSASRGVRPPLSWRSPVQQCRSHSTTAEVVDKKKYSHTLLLPSTTFPLRHIKPHKADQQYRQRTTIDLYRKQRSERDRPEFVLHDGPPYANGNLHMGHALNRVLKDMINRYKLIRGHRIHYIPGWDCHGLPIEQKALKEAGTSHIAIDPIRVREIARKTALEGIALQKAEMQEMGIMADWNDEGGTYRTLSPDFQVRQLKLFTQLVDRGLITHRLKPVWYSPSSRTALAEAELKYKDDHKSRSVYVTFPLTRMSEGLKRVAAGAEVKEIYLAIWTTTPWTLPANMGVMVSNKLKYSLVSCQGKTVLIASERVSALGDLLGEMRVLGELTGEELIGARYSHRFAPEEGFPILPSRYVTADSGTGLVHSAPAHGHEDYDAFISHGILPNELRCPVDDAGLFTADVQKWSNDDSASLVGKSVLGDGVAEVIRLLRADGSLLAEQTIHHRYPTDWKTKEPVIVRATPQWFADLSDIKSIAHDSLDRVHFHPPQSRKRLEAFIDGRSEWCISRQRSWGVPIPALFQDGKPLLDSRVIRHVIGVLEEKGMDAWWREPAETFAPPGLEGRITKGIDTLDVWFDSGSSWTMLDARPDGVADVYLEGSDQHRGWFQSSLLTHVGSTMQPVAPFRNLITHGFILDEEGQKMSKSSGNGISPLDVIKGGNGLKPSGADVLRLWAASVDYSRDVSMGPSAIRNAAEALRKIRSAMRYILANSSQTESTGDKRLSLLDQYLLGELSRVQIMAANYYDGFAFSKVLNVVSTFLSQTMSTFYFSCVKDTLYSDKQSDAVRIGVVYTLRQVFHTLVPILAPITPHLAEELWEHSGRTDSVFLTAWPSRPPQPSIDIEPLLQIRSYLLVLGEAARAEKGLKSIAGLDVAIDTALPYKNHDIIQILGVAAIRSADDLSSAWRISRQVETAQGSIKVTAAPALDSQCARCWRHAVEQQGEELCRRCISVVA